VNPLAATNNGEIEHVAPPPTSTAAPQTPDDAPAVARRPRSILAAQWPCERCSTRACSTRPRLRDTLLHLVERDLYERSGAGAILEETRRNLVVRRLASLGV
jgi:hypothetical protein